MRMIIRKNDKAGIIRIIEAFIAILLILGATVIVFSKFGGKNFESQNIIDIQKAVLNQIVSNAELRDEIIRSSETTTLSSKMTNIVAANIQKNYDFEIKVCELTDICSSNGFHKVVYAHERVVSSTLTEYSPKKIKLYVWPKE